MERQRDWQPEQSMALLPLVRDEAREEEVKTAQMTCLVGRMYSESWQRQG